MSQGGIPVPCGAQGREAGSLAHRRGQQLRRTPSSVGGIGCDGVELGVEAIDPLQDPRWDRWIREYPEAGPFHSAGWARVLADTYGHRPFYLRVTRGGRVLGLLPVMERSNWCRRSRGICLPFADRVAPLTMEKTDAGTLRTVLEELAGRRCWQYVEVRDRGCLPDMGGARRDEPTFYGHRVDLTGGADSLFAALDASVRRAVRKARRGGLQVRFSRSRESMRQFVELHGRTRQRHGAPPQPDAFFRKLHEALVGPQTGFVALVEDGARPVAGAVFLRFGTSALYKFGASDRESWPLRPNNLLMWEAIRVLAESGCTSLDLGRSAPGQLGLRRFKRALGAAEDPIFYRRFFPGRNRWDVVPASRPGWSPALFRRMPLSLNRLVGRLAYPYLD